jgi:2-isopropylmalate synthase
VMLTSGDSVGEWTTVGVSDDIVTASWEALADGLAYGLLRAGAEPPGAPLHLETIGGKA